MTMPFTIVEKVTPKCLWFSTNFTFSLLKTIQGLLATWLVEKIIHSVFFGLKFVALDA